MGWYQRRVHGDTTTKYRLHHISINTTRNTVNRRVTSSPNNSYILLIQLQYDWTRKGRKGSRQGWSQASSQDSSRQHPGYHKACYQTSRASWWCQAYLSHDLRRDPWCFKDLHFSRCRLRSQETRPLPLRFRRLNNPQPLLSLCAPSLFDQHLRLRLPYLGICYF